MVESINHNNIGMLTVLLAAGAIVVAGVAGRFDGSLYYVVLATAAILGFGALAALYRLRYD